MDLKAYWAYAFVCRTPIEEMLAILNAAGPWPWSLRDSYWYGDYLNSRPGGGVRVRIHEWPEESKYTALLQIDAEGTAERAAIDAVILDLLSLLQAEHIVATEPYD